MSTWSGNALATQVRLEVLRRPRALDRDVRGGLLHAVEIVRSQFDIDSAQVFVEPVQLGGAGNWNKRRFLRQHPGQRDLRRRRPLRRGDPLEQIDQRLIRLHGLGSEARQDTTQIVLRERCGSIHLAREKPLAERAKGNEPDSQFLQRRDDVTFAVARP